MLHTVPFPALPAWLAIDSENQPVALRLFGADLDDLSLEFAGLERARLITRLLARSARTRTGSAPPDQAIWELPVGKRIQAVIALAAGDPPRPLAWRVFCPACGAESELELSPSEIEPLIEEAYRERLVPVSLGERTLWLRRPTGTDQREWLENQSGGESALAANLFVEPTLAQLAAEGVTVDEVAGAIDEAMDQFDPLIGFHLDVRCAECGAVTTQAPDLLLAALENLWRTQFELIDQVHRLASRYHWSEEEIARLPEWRRQAYLAYTEAGE